MAFIPHTQFELQQLNLSIGKSYDIEYVNKDYYNGEETIEKGKGIAIASHGNIFFSVMDPYGMDKMVMQVKVFIT